MCGINNDITTRTRVDRSRLTGQCNNDGDDNAGRPLNLFQGDTLSANGGSGLFPRRPGGCGGIEDILARMANGDGKKQVNDVSNAGKGLFESGKDFGSASGSSDSGGAGQAMQQAMQGIQQVLGMVMNVVKAIMGIFGGL